MILETPNMTVTTLFALANALLLIVTLPLVKSASLRCDSHNRDPCTKFPSLCTEGGGLCVIKGPCEYECVCPPNGRRGRDCSNNGLSRPSPKDADQTSNNGGSHVESLLVFPQNLFWDVNHVEKPLEMIRRTSPRPAQGIADLNTRETSTVENKSQTVGKNENDQPTTTTISLQGKITQHTDTSTDPVITASSQRPTSVNILETVTTRELLPPAIEAETKMMISSNLHKSTFPSTPHEQTITLTAPSKQGADVRFSKIGSNVLNNQRKSDVSTTQIIHGSEETVTVSPMHDTVVDQQTMTTSATKSSDATSMVSQTGQLSVFDKPRQSLPNGAQSVERSSMTPENHKALLDPTPRHEMFPIFFSDAAQSEDKPNAALSRVVQRVFHVPDAFPVFKRNRK